MEAKRRKRHFANLAGCIFAMALLLWSLWQLDLIVGGSVWQKGWKPPADPYSEAPFQSWFWRTTVGRAYDALFFAIFASFWILFASLWFWD